MIRAEWMKFRTVPGWVAGIAAAAVLLGLLGFLLASGTAQSCMNGTQEVACPAPPTGPGGEAVRDQFSFAHQPMSGDGQITAQVNAMSGIITYPPPNHDQIVSGVEQWAKAGIMIKSSTTPGAAYAAVFLTGSHGVRMQSNFTRDVAGPDLAGSAWVRLKRTGDSVVGYASADGLNWHEIDRVRLPGLPQTAQIGLAVTSPSDITDSASPHGGHVVAARFTQTTAQFAQVTPAGTYAYTQIGRDGDTDWEKTHPPGSTETAGVYTVTGSGDIAPQQDGLTFGFALSGIYVALLPILAVAAAVGTAEFRRGMIRTTLAATPSRARLVAAQATVLGAAAFVTGLVATGVTLPVAIGITSSHHVRLLPVPWFTSIRVVVGTAALMAFAAVLAYGIGFFLRRTVPALVIATVLLIVPMVLATTSVLPTVADEWLLRVTPAAAFAIRQSIPAYTATTSPHTPADGFFPLAPWAGFAVLLLWAGVAVAAAAHRLRRADA